MYSRGVARVVTVGSYEDAATVGRYMAAVGAFLAKVLVLVVYLALVESSYAKLRFFRVPQFLGLGFVCAFLALALRVL